MQNVFVGSFNGRLRDEWLADQIFSTLAQARKILEKLGINNNTQKPHISLGRLAPTVYATLKRTTQPAALELRKGSARAKPRPHTYQQKNTNER